MITWLELGVTDGVSVSLLSPLILAVGCQAVRLSQVVRQERRVLSTETFDHSVLRFAHSKFQCLQTKGRRTVG
jgi:hypothetical protein